MGSVIDSVYFLVSHFYKHVSYSNACKYYWLHFAYVLSMSKHGAYIFLIFLCVKKLLHLF